MKRYIMHRVWTCLPWNDHHKSFLIKEGLIGPVATCFHLRNVSHLFIYCPYRRGWCIWFIQTELKQARFGMYVAFCEDTALYNYSQGFPCCILISQMYKWNSLASLKHTNQTLQDEIISSNNSYINKNVDIKISAHDAFLE